jgi:hypothetical protein
MFDISTLSSFCNRGHAVSPQTGKAPPSHPAETGTGLLPARGLAACRWKGLALRPQTAGVPLTLFFARLLERVGPLPCARPDLIPDP